MTDKTLDDKHDANCDYIVRQISQLNLNNCVNWQKVQLSETDDPDYMKKLYLKKKEGKQ